MAPTMSQMVKAAARKGKQLEETTDSEGKGDSKFVRIAAEFKSAAPKRKRTSVAENVENKTAQKQTAVTYLATKKAARKRAFAPSKGLDVSVTISVGSTDIPITYLKKIEEFLEKECVSGLCSIEKGEALSGLHLQMVCRILASSPSMVSKCIKTYLGWDKVEAAPVGHYILTETLYNNDLHTFIGMLGYCIKDRGEEHFECVYRNVTLKQIAKGVEENIKHNTPFAKNKIILTHKNLIERAATFYKYKMKKQLGSTLSGTLLLMLQSRQYIPSACWIRQGGMEYTSASSLWKCMMNPKALSMDDVTQIFFEHTNPGSHLADLGR